MQSTENNSLQAKTKSEWINEFKDLWAEADERGDIGSRVAFALDPILESLYREQAKAERANTKWLAADMDLEKQCTALAAERGRADRAERDRDDAYKTIRALTGSEAAE